MVGDRSAFGHQATGDRICRFSASGFTSYMLSKFRHFQEEGTSFRYNLDVELVV